MKSAWWLMALTLVVGQSAGAGPALANAGVFTGNGQNVRQVTSKTIQLITVDVVIVLGRGRFPFDGSVPGMDQAEYTCKFVLRNLSDSAEQIQVGFPVDSDFARGPAPAPGDSTDWVLNYSFIARDDEKTYHVDFIQREPKSPPDDSGAIFVWKMNFAPLETRTLRVQYRIPISMGLVSTRKEGSDLGQHLPILTQELLEISAMEVAGYVTSTGSSWAGNVQTATFTVMTKAFEFYLNRRPFFEESSELGAEDAARMREKFPVQHPWWFRRITPAGWQAIDGGVQWRYKDFKPHDPISVRYDLTQIPRLPEEVDAFVDSFLKSLGRHTASRTEELRFVREIVLATYGKEPESDAAKTFAAAQVWYAPRKDFSMADLTAAQQAVVKALDRRIAVAK